MSTFAADVPPLADSTRASLASFDLTIDEARRADYYRAGWWRSQTAVDDFVAASRSHPDKIAIVTYSSTRSQAERISYADLERCMRRIAAAFLHLGVSSGDVVSAQLPNWWQFAAVALASQWIGAAFNPILPIHRRREVGFITDLLQSKIYVVPRTYRGFDYAEMLSQVGTSGRYSGTRIILDARQGKASLAQGELSFDAHLLHPSWEDEYRDALAACHVDADGLSDIMFTSGTTGEPKGAGHTHNTLFARARTLYEPLALTEHDVVFMPSPLAHSTGFVYGCMTPLMRGMTAVYQDVWEPAVALDIIEAERPTWTFGSTSFIIDLLRACRKYPRDVSPLRYFVAGGATIPPAVVKEARDELGTRVMAVWGMTENGAVTVTQPGEPDLASAESDGRPCPWMELKVVAPGTGAVVPPDQDGSLLSRGANQMLGYVRRPALTAATLDSQGWLDTGDLGRLDCGGHLRITGRSKDIIIRGGENIPVAEIEALLYEHPGVFEVALVGYSDARLGERACAVVVPNDTATLTLDDLTAYLDAAGVSKTYWPERLDLRPDLPRTASGKVQKYRLRESLEARGRMG